MGLKRGLAVFMTATLIFGTTAYGAGLATIVDKDGAAVESEQAEVPVRTITYEEAVELAVKNNSSLKKLADEMDTLEDQKEQLWYMLALKALPESMQPVVIPNSTISLFENVNAIETGMDTIKYSKQMTEEACELMVKNYFAAIVQNENNLEMVKKNCEMVSKTTHFNRLKYDLGMISETEFKAALNEHKAAEYNVQLMQMSVDTAYNNLKRLIGIKDEKVVIDYAPVFSEYPVQADLDVFANRKIINAPTLLMAEDTVEAAEFKMNYIALDNATSYESREKNLNDAGRKYNDTKNDLLLAVKNGYFAVKQAELNIANLEAKLEEAERTYETAKLSHSLGYVTDVELIGAGLGVDSARNNYETAVLNHDLAKFMLDHPYLSAGSSTQQKQQ